MRLLFLPWGTGKLIWKTPMDFTPKVYYESCPS
jgi:hypothetical protein